MAYIEQTRIPGLAVLGVNQYDYTVDGREHLALIDTVGAVAFVRATAMESMTQAMAAQTRFRREKLAVLGEAMSEAAAAAAVLGEKKLADIYTSTKLREIYVELVKWGLADCVSCLGIDGSLSKKNLGRFQNNVQMALDRENSKVKQVTLALKSFIKKRDQAFDNATKAVKKISHSAETAVNEIGR